MKRTKIKAMLAAIIGILALSAATILPTFAADDQKYMHYLQISPVSQKISLEPGSTYNGAFKVNNIGDGDFEYTIGVAPYSVTGDNYSPSYENDTTYTQLSKWITFDKENGNLKPNESAEIKYTINVPSDVPNGGQYAAITASVDNNDNTNVKTVSRAAMIVYAHVVGETRETGNIVENSLPGFVLGGNKISATSLVENTGNVHSEAKYTLKAYPFGSSEEVYTNEENPDTRIILPETKRYNTLTWEETPQLGLYTVEQTIEFMGQTSTTSKLVLVCPIWLIVIFIALIFAIIFTVVMRARSRKQGRKESSSSRDHAEED